MVSVDERDLEPGDHDRLVHGQRHYALGVDTYECRHQVGGSHRGVDLAGRKVLVQSCCVI